MRTTTSLAPAARRRLAASPCGPRRPVPLPRAGLAVAACLLALLVSACGGEAPPAQGARATGWNGRFRAQGERGPVVLELTERDGVVTVSMNGESATGRVVAPGRVEGSETSEAGTGTFVFERQEDRLLARFTVAAPGGERLELPEMVFERVPEGAAAPSGARDPALVGHWRWTEARASGGFTMATDVHLVLEANGRYETWSQSAGSFGSSGGERTSGSWQTAGGVLRLRPDAEDAFSDLGRYQVSDAGLLLTRPNGDKQVYERI